MNRTTSFATLALLALGQIACSAAPERNLIIDDSADAGPAGFGGQGAAATGGASTGGSSTGGAGPTGGPCARGLDDCDENATCTDEGDSFTCACNDGYTGDGRTCENIDECADGSHDCDANATCVDTPGSFTCDCTLGYMGDGRTCENVDECANGTHDCDRNATCTDNVGGFDCECLPGFTGDGASCVTCLGDGVDALRVGEDPPFFGTTAQGSGTVSLSCNWWPSPGADIALAYTAPVTGYYVFDTSGSLFDTVMAVFDADGCDELACDDDSGDGLQSTIVLQLEAGRMVLVVVQGFEASEFGAYTLDVTHCEGGGICASDRMCIDPGRMCDGSADCTDGSDEFPVNGSCGWICDPQWYDDGIFCDCGCGIVDPDCASSEAAACEFCDGGGCIDALNTAECQAAVAPGNNAVCHGSGCFFCGGSNTCIDPSQACNGRLDCEAGNDEYPLHPGCGWLCPADWYGDNDELSFCDCGCGIPDPNCADDSRDACGWCGNTANGGCAETCDDVIDGQSYLCSP
jgi:hypothetical protein